jgi:hypothetical protein
VGKAKKTYIDDLRFAQAAASRIFAFDSNFQKAFQGGSRFKLDPTQIAKLA